MTVIIFHKVFIQLKRDKLILILTLLCTPLFIFLYKLIYLDGMTKYRVVVVNEQTTYNLNGLKSFLEEREYPGGGELFQLFEVDSYDDAFYMVKEHNVKVFLYLKVEEICILGNYADPYFVLSANLLEKFIWEYWGTKTDVPIQRRALGLSKMKKEFESYIPGLYIFSTLILLYLFTLLLVREKESGLYLRYHFTGMKRSVYYRGNSLVFLFISIVNLLITTMVAYAAGYHSPNSMFWDILQSIILCSILNLAVTGISFIVVRFSKNSTQALLLVTFPFLIFVFLSGSVYIFPPIWIYKIIPSTLGVNLMDRCLTYGEMLWHRPIDLLLMILESTGLYLLGYFSLRFSK